MDEEKGVRLPTLSKERTVTSFARNQQDLEELELWSGDERLGYRNVPYKEFVSTLGFSCTIGIAIAASAAFSILAAGSIFGDTSPEAFHDSELRHMATLLAWSAGCYANATAIVLCLQFLYSSPSFCKVITQKINYTWEFRRKNEPWDMVRCIIAYGSVGWGFFSLILQLAGTILMVEALRPFAPVLLAEIPISLVSLVGAAFILTGAATGAGGGGGGGCGGPAVVPRLGPVGGFLIGSSLSYFFIITEAEVPDVKRGAAQAFRGPRYEL
ncbi:hypothetical protein M407DRAFT_4688 [Tulasnella calospora MUT 4182]|uniref:Uncharacterized protein n=1 Tax=Tulasnella calospora MUT 4182 TaxID=1051891 RepID=A0A0C3QIY5_9AGAM|nr:hypothetical protein M407DRAFT_4688 [Tulasnella calospora MUT 4182]